MLHQTIGNPVNSRKQAMLFLCTVGLFNVANNLCLDDLPMNNDGFSHDFPWQLRAPAPIAEPPKV